MKKYTLLFGVFFICWASISQKNTTEHNNTGTVVTCSDFHITKPLSELSKENPYEPQKKEFWEQIKESKDRENRSPQTFEFKAEDNQELYGTDPSTVQTEFGPVSATNKAPIKNWPGQTATGFRPMDPSGAAGPNHYIQAINGTPFRVFDKNTGANLLTANIGSLWSPATPDDGDPIILYDKYADRWVITQFGQTGNKIYIAISKTPDPLGQYYTYSFTSPQFPDYLKFGIWENGYYMTSNQATDRVFCFERDQMLVGNASARAISQTFTTGSVSAFFVPLPADADGGLPAAGTPCPFFSYSDNAWGAGATDAVKIWNMTVTWGATPVATITLNSTLPTASAFDASYDASWNDVTQPGTAQKLDGIGGVPTYRAQWRKWTGYNSVVMNWGIKISATQRGIKWVELRQNTATGAWSIYQEGTYSPSTHTYWLGSIAMDNNGSIALCYAKSSSTVYPSLCYTGRLATDPLGTMSLAETVAAAGTGAETGGNRFGDYSQTSIDPDGVTFWHTGEYTLTSGTTTRVYSFQIPLPAGQTASVTISSSDLDNSICAGASVTFTAVAVNGGAAPTYQWKLNGTNIVGATSSTYVTSALTTGQSITCQMTSNLVGVIGSPATSNAIVTTVNPTPATPVVTTNSPVCLGSAINLTTPTVATATYAWTGVNSYTNATQNPTIVTSTALMAGAYNLIITVNGCPSLAGTSSVVVTPTVLPSVVIAISAGTNPTCASQSVTFTATPTNGGTTPTYQWKVNGVNAGTNSVTFTPATIANGAIITCVMTSTASCPSNTTATSNAITMTVTSTLVPSVSIVSNNNPFCLGSAVTFTPTPVNGGTAPTYQWLVNGVNNIIGATFTSSTIANNDIVTCVMTSNSACASPLTATSNAITMLTSGSVIPSVAITASATTICTGASTVFTAVPTNGGTTPVYQWKVNGVNIGTNLITFTSTTIANNDIVTCVMTSNSACASPLTGTSNAITMIVSGSVLPSVAISLTAGTNPSCTGSSVTFTAVPTNGGTTPTYQWKVNGVNTLTGATFTSTTLANNDIVTCVMTSSSSCASPLTGTSNAITMTLSTSLTPTVTIALTSGTNPACPGTTETFTATSTNGGTPVYQWKVNGVNIVTGSTFTSSTLANNDIVTCVLTSNAACISTTTATSNAITMNMVGTTTPTISISSSSPSNCIGSLVTFNSVITNGGTLPTYVWNVNGFPIGTGSTYLSSTITAIDVVTCILTSNATCLSTPTATSNPLTVNLTSTVTPAVSVAITFGANPACQGANLSFTASSTNGGTNPSYVWKINGIAVSGANSTIFSSSTLSNNDIVTCVLTSNAPCASTTTVTSTGTPITIYPIPATPTITHVGTVLTSSSATGNQWYLNGVIIIGATSQSYTSTINGIYTVIVDNNNGCPSNVSANYVENSVGLYDVANEGTHFVIFPNPSNGLFTVVFTSSEIMKYKIELINELGQIVFLEEIKDFNGTYTKDFDVTQKGRGEYFLRITDSKKNQMEKVIVY